MIVRVVAAAAALVLGLGTVAAPAMATPRTVPAPTLKAPADAAPAGELRPKAGNPKTRYCVVTEITGSRLPRRQCQTRQQWLEVGYDPLNDLRR
jgi:hypothetical protein